MPRLVYLTGALRDLAGIAEDIEDASRSRTTALSFIGKLTRHCEHVATLPGLLGRARHELRRDYRSFAFGSYIVFFRYLDEAAPRDLMEVIHVIHGARDIGALFRQTDDDL